MRSSCGIQDNAVRLKAIKSMWEEGEHFNGDEVTITRKEHLIYIFLVPVILQNIYSLGESSRVK